MPNDNDNRFDWFITNSHYFGINRTAEIRLSEVDSSFRNALNDWTRISYRSSVAAQYPHLDQYLPGDTMSHFRITVTETEAGYNGTLERRDSCDCSLFHLIWDDDNPSSEELIRNILSNNGIHLTRSGWRKNGCGVSFEVVGASIPDFPLPCGCINECNGRLCAAGCSIDSRCYEDLCGNCGGCEDHCDCIGCDDCGEQCYRRNPFIAKKSELVHFNCKRLVGAEVEYNKCVDSDPLNRFQDQWRAGNHEDGSCGYEIVTAPLSGDYIEKCITDLGAAFKKANTKADEQCGIHVHVDASDYSWTDMYRLLGVYAKLEPLLYLLAGQHRAANHYCKPVGILYSQALSRTDRKGSILGVAYSSHDGYQRGANEARDYIKERKPQKKDEGRYRGLNICPWLSGRRERKNECQHQRLGEYDPFDGWISKKRKNRNEPKYRRRARNPWNTYSRSEPVGGRPDSTVEFRIHRNSLDPARIISWMKVCARIVDWCHTASDKEANDLPRSPLKALCKIAPDCKEWILHRVKQWRAITSAVPRSKIGRRISFAGGNYKIVDKGDSEAREEISF